MNPHKRAAIGAHTDTDGWPVSMKRRLTDIPHKDHSKQGTNTAPWPLKRL